MSEPVKERIAELAAKIAPMTEPEAVAYMKRIGDWHSDIINEKGYDLVDAIADVLDDTDPYGRHLTGES